MFVVIKIGYGIIQFCTILFFWIFHACSLLNKQFCFIISLGVSMHTHLHMESSLFKNFLPISNSLKYLGSLMTELSKTEGSSYFVSFFAYFTSLVLTLILPLFDSLSSKEDAFTITCFDLLFSLEQTCDSLLSALILFDYLLS